MSEHYHMMSSAANNLSNIEKEEVNVKIIFTFLLGILKTIIQRIDAGAFGLTKSEHNIFIMLIIKLLFRFRYHSRIF